MGLIADGKKDLAKAVEQELECLAAALEQVQERALEASEDAQGINGLSGKLKALTNTLQVEIEKLRDNSTEALKKLGHGREPIHERVNEDHAKAVVAAAAAEPIA